MRLAGLGGDIAIFDRNLQATEVYEFESAAMTAATVMAECETKGVRALGIEADLTSRAAATSAIDDIVRQLGRIDIAVCNAGGGTVVFADERPSSPGANETGDAVTSGTPSDCPEEMYSLMRGKSGSGGSYEPLQRRRAALGTILRRRTASRTACLHQTYFARASLRANRRVTQAFPPSASGDRDSGPA